MIAVVDSGPLYACADASDRDHERSLEVLERRDLHLVIPALVVTEVSYMIGTRLGPSQEATFLKGLSQFDVDTPAIDDWQRIAELVDRYSDFPLGGVDASVVTLAERLDTQLVITLDRRHFSAVRPRHRESLDLLP